jgi:uncharacterized membrane protein
MEINIWSVIVATVVTFIIGAIWYSPVLFGKEWMTLTGCDDKQVNDAKKKGVVKFYIIQLIITFISFCVLGFAMSAIGANTTSNGAFIGILAWLGFIFPMNVGSLMWERRPFKLVLINSVNTLLNFVVGGAIIGAW